MTFARRLLMFVGGIAVAVAILSFLLPSEITIFGGRSRYASDSVLSARLASAISQESTLDLQAVLGFAEFKWERVFFFAPYTPRRIIEQKLGTSPGFRWNSLIEVTEGYVLVVFKEKNRVVAYFDFPSSSGDFSQAAEDPGFCDRPAVFRVVTGPEKTRKVIPFHTKPNSERSAAP